MPPSRKQPDTKTHTLQRQGNLHPNPEEVVDELFASGNEFFDRRDLVQVRYEMVRRVRADKLPVAAAAARFGVSRPTYYKVEADFEASGLPGLLPRKRGPKGGHKLNADVVDALLDARAKAPSLSAASLAELVREQFGFDVHASSVARALRRQEKKRPSQDRGANGPSRVRR
jgi:transposase